MTKINFEKLFKYKLKVFQLVLYYFLFALPISCNINKEGETIKNSNIYVTPSEGFSPVSVNQAWPKSFGFGKKATTQEIKLIDIDIKPDGSGLPKGSGNAATGKLVYATKCAACHGATGTEGPRDRLVGGWDVRQKTIGNYWPYATTLYDYINRAMPYGSPGTLSADEVYSLTAFLLNANGIIDKDLKLDAASLPEIEMPARHLFVVDDREETNEIR